MEIAIVAPKPVPYNPGGAEAFCQNLILSLNSIEGVACELIAFDSPEHTCLDLLESYRKFACLDLNRFDLVISTKYPSWAVSHRNHICYMVHPLRGLYDTYHLFGLPQTMDWSGEGLIKLQEHMASMAMHPKKDNAALIELIGKVEGLICNPVYNYLNDLDKFPGPFIREVVKFIDSYSLASNRVRSHYCISQTVAERQGYFPPDVSPSVFYPAPLIKNFRCGSYDYAFTVSRLDSPKRIDLIINSFFCTKSECKLYIAGDGPEGDYLRNLCINNDKVFFLGRVSDQELIELYSNALVVVYVPLEEDYGLVTIEAMQSAKPVIIANDSGGPKEFVEDGVNGFVVAPVPESIAEKIDLLYENKGLAEKLGVRGKKLTSKLTSNSVAEVLIGDVKNIPSRSVLAGGGEGNIGMVVVSTFPVFPPRGGGQVRIFNLYREMAKYLPVEIISLVDEVEGEESIRIGGNLTETRVQVTPEFYDHEAKMNVASGGVPIRDIALIEGWSLIPCFQENVARASSSANILVISHPFLFGVSKAVSNFEFVWFEAHNVELDLKTSILRGAPEPDTLLALVREVEERCWVRSDIVFSCCETDLFRLGELYPKTLAKTCVVKNGVDPSQYIEVFPTQKKVLKERLGLGGQKVAVFLGSWHGPNIDAVRAIFEFSIQTPEIVFLIVGSVCNALREDFRVPSNVLLIGEVSESEKDLVMYASDVAINPMTSGAGSNLKIFDYVLHGLPLISTSFGVRGSEFRPEVHFLEANLDDFPIVILHFFGLKNRYNEMPKEALLLARAQHSWSILAKELVSFSGIGGN